MERIISILTFMFILSYSHAQFKPLVFNFDSIEPIFIDTNLPNNIWEIGKPEKRFFYSAYTFPNAILTDKINFYPTNNSSEFIVRTPTYISNWGGVTMTFQHKFETDTLLDGGTILVSSNGNTWTNLINSAALKFSSYNIYSGKDSIKSLLDVGFSGNSKGWQDFHCYWNYPPADTLWIKFKFASDPVQTNKEGWMIDNLVFSYDLGIGINELNLNSPIHIFPNPTSDFIFVGAHNSRKYRTMTIKDIIGKTILTTDKETIDLSGFQPGLYFAEIITDKEFFLAPLLKQ